MGSDERAAAERAQLRFADVVRERFAFLADYGFSMVEALPTVVHYTRCDLELNVYHGQGSYEVGIDIGHGDERFSMGALIRSTDPVSGAKYRDGTATSSESLVSGVERLAELVRRYGERALRDEPEFFADLRRQRKAWAEAYSLDVLAEQTRPKAEAAFREGRYRDAAELYEKMAARLTPTEQAKLAAARKRS